MAWMALCYIAFGRALEQALTAAGDLASLFTRFGDGTTTAPATAAATAGAAVAVEADGGGGVSATPPSALRLLIAAKRTLWPAETAETGPT